MSANNTIKLTRDLLDAVRETKNAPYHLKFSNKEASSQITRFNEEIVKKRNLAEELFKQAEELEEKRDKKQKEIDLWIEKETEKYRIREQTLKSQMVTELLKRKRNGEEYCQNEIESRKIQLICSRCDKLCLARELKVICRSRHVECNDCLNKGDKECNRCKRRKEEQDKEKIREIEAEMKMYEDLLEQLETEKEEDSLDPTEYRIELFEEYARRLRRLKTENDLSNLRNLRLAQDGQITEIIERDGKITKICKRERIKERKDFMYWFCEGVQLCGKAFEEDKWEFSLWKGKKCIGKEETVCESKNDYFLFYGGVVYLSFLNKHNFYEIKYEDNKLKVTTLPDTDSMVCCVYKHKDMLLLGTQDQIYVLKKNEVFTVLKEEGMEEPFVSIVVKDGLLVAADQNCKGFVFNANTLEFIKKIEFEGICAESSALFCTENGLILLDGETKKIQLVSYDEKVIRTTFAPEEYKKFYYFTSFRKSSLIISGSKALLLQHKTLELTPWEFDIDDKYNN